MRGVPGRARGGKVDLNPKPYTDGIPEVLNTSGSKVGLNVAGTTVL